MTTEQEHALAREAAQQLDSAACGALLTSDRIRARIPVLLAFANRIHELRVKEERAAVPRASGAALISKERARQIAVEDWTPEHDDHHTNFEITSAACCYAVAAELLGVKGFFKITLETVSNTPDEWPWDFQWWKPSADPIRNLVKAGALIAAEIDRLQRLKTSLRATLKGERI
jgi:hypothetical protein